MKKPETIAVQPCLARWGRFPTYLAKVGTMGSTCIVVKRTRRFHVGQSIQFAETSDLTGMCKGMPPRWRYGDIWKIEDDRLFVNL